jgi:hypothetical protein
MTGFAVQLRAFANKTKAKNLSIHKAAIKGLEVAMSKPRQEGGNLPFKTGNLYNSRMVSVKSAPEISGANAKFADPTGYIEGVIANLELRSKVYLGFRASYAPIQEIRCAFVRLAVQQWPAIKAQAIKDNSGKASYGD